MKSYTWIESFDGPKAGPYIFTISQSTGSQNNNPVIHIYARENRRKYLIGFLKIDGVDVHFTRSGINAPLMDMEFITLDLVAVSDGIPLILVYPTLNQRWVSEEIKLDVFLLCELVKNEITGAVSLVLLSGEHIQMCKTTATPNTPLRREAMRLAAHAVLKQKRRKRRST